MVQNNYILPFKKISFIILSFYIFIFLFCLENKSLAHASSSQKKSQMSTSILKKGTKSPEVKKERAHVPRNGLVAEYLFEGNAQDTSGNEHHGVEEGDLNYVPGKINLCAGFDGQDDAIKISDDPGLEFGKGPFSISAWFYAQGNTDMMSILDHMIDSGCKYSTNERSFLLRIWKGKLNLVMYETKKLRDQHQFKTKTKIKVKNWHFFSVVYDGISSVKMYHNLEKVCEEAYSKGLSSTSAPWYIGARYCRQKHPHWFHGKIDNIRIYNRALSFAEIQDLYAEGASREKPDAITQSSPPGIEKGGHKSEEPWLAAAVALPGTDKIKAKWQEVGRQSNPAGDLSIWGYFSADSADVDWGDSASPEVFVDICKSGGHIKIDFYNVSRGQVHVLSAYPWPDPVDRLKTTKTDWRYAQHMFKDGQGTSRAYAHDSGNQPQTRSDVSPLPHRVAGNLLLGAVIQDPEKGPVQTRWRPGAYGFTKRGDQFVWGYFQKRTEDSPDGSNIPAIYAKVWLDSSGMIDIHFVNAFDHDVLVHSGYPAVRGFVHRDRCTVSDPYARHKYQRKTGRWQLDLPPTLSRDGLRVLTPGGETVVTEGSSIAPGHLSLQPSFYPAYHNDRLVALTFVTLPGANIRFTCRETAASVVLFKAGLTALPPSKMAVWKNLIMSMPAVSDLGNQLCTELQNHNALQNPSPALQQKIEKTVLSVGQHFLNPPQNKP